MHPQARAVDVEIDQYVIAADAELRRRVMQGNVYTDDPLREITREERRALLGVSTASILIAKTGLVPSEIQNLGIKFTPAEQSGLLLGLAVVVTYFLIVFIVYAMTDWLGVMWGLHVNALDLEHQARLTAIERGAGNAEVKAPASPVAPFKFRRLTAVMGHTRRFLDFALPIAVAAFALASIGVAIRDGAQRPPPASHLDHQSV